MQIRLRSFHNLKCTVWTQKLLWTVKAFWDFITSGMCSCHLNGNECIYRKGRINDKISANNLFRFSLQKFKYLLKIDNWMEWFLYMTSLVYMFQYHDLYLSKDNSIFSIKAVAATAIFIAWVIFVLYLRR